MHKLNYLLLMLLFASVVFGQGVITSEGLYKGNGVQGYFTELYVTGPDTLYTNAFRLPEKEMNVFTYGEQANDSIYVKIDRQISAFTLNSGSYLWQADGTVGIDSVKTVKAWADTSAYKDVWHRLLIITTAKNGDSTAVKIRVSTQ